MSISKINPKFFLGAMLPNAKLLSSKVDTIIDQVNANETAIAAVGAELDAMNLSTNVGPLISTEVVITSANIAAMYAAPVRIINAPGDGYVIQLMSAVLVYTYVGAAYTGGGDVTLRYDSGGAAITTTITAANSFAAAGDKVFSFGLLNAAGGYTMPINTGITITNATGAFVDPGPAVGTGKVVLSYRILKVIE